MFQSRKETTEPVVQKYIRLNQALEIVPFSKSHLFSIISRGELKVYKPSPKILLIKLDDLISYVEQSMEQK